MSKYTTEVRFICEKAADKTQSVGFNSVDEVINAAIPVVFAFNFPIFDENYRNTLCAKILRHYYTREISEETVGLWKMRLYTRLNEIMPYYNQLYKSELLTFNPLYDVDLTTENTGSSKQTSDNTGSETASGTDKETNTNTKNTTTNNTIDVDTTSKANGTVTNSDTRKDLYSDTPQGALTGVESETYLTNARKIDDSKSEVNSNTGEGTSKTVGNYTDNATESENKDKSYSNKIDRTENSNISNMEQYITHVRGKTGGASYSKLLDEFRKTFLNIDMQVIDELSDLFFGLW